MGKVLSSFGPGFAGAIARSIDDVVIAMPNTGDSALAFGVPVVLDEDKIGVQLFGSENTAADFIGVTVRNPSKTPTTYGSNEGSYAGGEMVDILVRGHIVVKVVSATPAPNLGDAVAIMKSNGKFSFQGSGETTKVPLTNARFTSVPDSNGMAEIVLDKRNVL